MTARRIKKTLDHLRSTLRPDAPGLTDGQLLSRFVVARDETAFAALLHRHGHMVFNVCRRLLRHVHDAEDAFQATFLVLARKAHSLSNGEAVGNWLYGVAYRIALDAKAVNARRQSREKQVQDMPHPPVAPYEPQDWRAWLDHELNLLPVKYRTAVVLCDLEGRSRREAALQLGLPEGTLSSRLAAARRLLAKRLSRYGLSLSGGALAGAIAEGVASAHVPLPLLSLTTKSAVQAVVITSTVEILVKGALKTMLLTKLKLAVGSVLVVAALGASGLVYRASGQSSPTVEERRFDSKPRSEVETLRRENELLKLNLEVVLEKVRAQEAELRTFRRSVGDAKARQQKSEQLSQDRAQALLDLARVADVAARKQALDAEQRARAEAVRSVTTRQVEKEAAAKKLQEALRKAQQEKTAMNDLQESMRLATQNKLSQSGDAKRLADAWQEVDGALKALRDARDEETQRRAMDTLSRALQKVREQQVGPDRPGRK